MTPHTPVETPSTLLTRRTALRTAAWSVPAVSVITAAPAFALSTDAWTITSASYEGDETLGPGQTSLRNDNAWIVFRFTISVAAGATVPSPTASFSTQQSIGTGAAIAGLTWAQPTGVVDGWTATGTNVGTSNDAFRTFTFTRGEDIIGPASVTLNFTLQGASSGSGPDIPAEGRPFTFSSGSFITGPTTEFTVLPRNTPTATDPNGYITTPHI